MGWVWSDELADALRRSPEVAPLIPPSWSARPSAFVAEGDENLVAAGKRLLGLVPNPPADRNEDGVECTCGAASASTQRTFVC